MYSDLKVITIDNFFKNPQQVRDFVSKISYTKDIKILGLFHGLRSKIGLDNQIFYDFFKSILKKEYNDDVYIPFKKKRLYVNCIDMSWKNFFKSQKSIDRPDGKDYLGCVPHTDCMFRALEENMKKLFASTVWLNLPEECHGGTAFWNFKPLDTQFYYPHIHGRSEEIRNGAPDRIRQLFSLPSYRDYVTKFIELKKTEKYKKIMNDWDWPYSDEEFYKKIIKKYEKKENPFWTESNEKWELLGFTPMKFNRMVIYQGAAFHSQYIEEGNFIDYPRISIQNFF
mgnify:CR=1 FL=1